MWPAIPSRMLPLPPDVIQELDEADAAIEAAAREVMRRMGEDLERQILGPATSPLGIFEPETDTPTIVEA